MIQSEVGKLKRLEERLGILQSARLPVLPQPTFRDDEDEEENSQVEIVRGGEEDGDKSESGNEQGSRLTGLEMKELSVAQRRKVMMLRAKRERLERERERLTS